MQQIPETHCENPEAEPYVGRDGIGKTFGLKLSSYRHEWQHLILGGRKCFIGPGQIWRWTSFAADLRESQHMAPIIIRKHKVKHLVDLYRIIWLHSYKLHVCLAKDDHMAVFAHYANSSGGHVNCRRLHDQQLSPGQIVLLPMQT